MAVVTIPYAPREWQQEQHNTMERFTVLVVHRRAGKTIFAINELLKRVMNETKKNPRVAYLAPTYTQAKRIAWDEIKFVTAGIPGVKVNESELRVDLPGGRRIMVLGADNPDSLRGLYLDYVVMDEVADMPAPIWGAVIRPALADRKGGALFIGTPKGKNFFHELYVRGKGTPDWKSVLLSYHDTGALDPVEVESLRAELTEEEFEQELECSFTAAIRGAYYGKAMARCEADGRITRVKYNPDYPVVSAWDIGFDGTSIWYAQFINEEVRLIDFDNFSEQDVPYCINVVKNKPYVYEYQILPHDAKKRSNLDRRKTVMGQIQSFGLKCRVAQRSGILDGINATRKLINKAVMDIDKCQEGLESLRQYRAQYDEAKGVMGQNPVHDRHSHPADALRTLAMGMKEISLGSNKIRPSILGNYDPYKLTHNIEDQWDVYNN